MDEKKSIEELKELINGMELVVLTGFEVMKDGKINTSDFGSLINLLSKFKILVDAAQGMKEVKGEIKDLDQSELVELGSMLYSIVKKIKEINV